MTGCLTLLARLGRDNAGNTLAIAAASLLPMMALIGGGVDISRAYMAKTQLQSACDAGVLAGRKAMSKSGSYGDGEKAKATSMFNFNFNGKGLNIDPSDVSYTTDDNDDGQVLGTATAVVPTLLMKIFGKDTVDLSVDCMAELQIGNADIMFVLDTTGSMAQSISWGDPSKISGLRDAVRDFHKTIKQSVNDSRTRIRYGFVPYSMTVNAKGLLNTGALDNDAFSDSTFYQTRYAKFETGVDDVEETADNIEEYSGKLTKDECNLWGENDYPSNGSNPVTTGGPLPAAVNSTEYEYESWAGFKPKQTKKVNGKNVEIGTCKRHYVKTTTTRKYKFTRWVYNEDPLDTSSFKGFNSIEIVTDVNKGSSNPTLVDRSGDYNPIRLARIYRGLDEVHMDGGTPSLSSYTWNGCIEERKSEEPSGSYDFDPIPDDAYDLDLDSKPEDANTWWHPMWADVEYRRSTNGSLSYYYKYSDGKYYTKSNYSGTSYNSDDLPNNPSSNCPAQMMLFKTVSLADNSTDVNGVPEWLNTYLTNLNAEGNTYHDIGMTWGGRLTSATGLFASNVTLDADKINVSKHIIFMTDGVMEPTSTGYSAYGIETLDHRIAPGGYENTLTARHTARFAAQCEAIKAQGTTVWVIAFGTSMTTELQNCASNGRAYYSSNTEALRNTFKFIAAQVADLRLGA